VLHQFRLVKSADVEVHDVVGRVTRDCESHKYPVNHAGVVCPMKAISYAMLNHGACHPRMEIAHVYFSHVRHKVGKVSRIRPWRLLSGLPTALKTVAS
jgi:hypothetical protein